LSTIDIVIIIFVLFGAYRGYKDGFLMGMVTLLALVLAILAAFKLTGEGMEFLQEHFNADKEFLPYLSFFLIFLGVIILVTLLGKFLRHSIDKTFLGRIDEGAGALLGAVKTLFTLSVLMWIVDSLKMDLPEHWTEGSVVYPFTAHLAPSFANWVAQFLPFLVDVFPEF
jgi:membrane protein required for colicin V production